MLRYLILLALLAVVSNGQIMRKGPCPVIQAKAGFDANKFSGQWHTIKQYPNMQENKFKCPSMRYIRRSDGSYAVRRHHVYEHDNSRMTWDGEGRFHDASTSGKMRWNFPLVPVEDPSFQAQIIDTDYNNWAVLYSCADFTAFRMEQTWIMTKNNPTFYVNPSIEQNGISCMKKVGLPTSHLITMNQFFCPPPPTDTTTSTTTTTTSTTTTTTTPAPTTISPN